MAETAAPRAEAPASWFAPGDLPRLAFWVGLCYAAAAAGAAVTRPGVQEWYPTLAKPPWTPPTWLFGPAWTLLYTLMGLAAFRVARRLRGAGPGAATLPLGLFGVQLGLNVAWSGLFFGLRAPGIAFAEIVVLWGAIVATMAAFLRVDRAAAALLVPYLAWVTFAAALNAAVWRLNP